MNDPERDPWPSVEDDEPGCPYCEAQDGEQHDPHCPLADYPWREELRDSLKRPA